MALRRPPGAGFGAARITGLDHCCSGRGRTPMNEVRNHSKSLGRDYHPRAFTMWIAVGRIDTGLTFGKTDELGYNITEDPVDVHKFALHHPLSVGDRSHEAALPLQGRDFRLTDVAQQCHTQTDRISIYLHPFL